MSRTCCPREKAGDTAGRGAAALGCGRDTVYTLLGNGALPSVRLGDRLRRIRRCDLERFVAQMHPSLPTCPVARPASRSTAASSR
jgi:excisionase family DNA binding protein